MVIYELYPGLLIRFHKLYLKILYDEQIIAAANIKHR